MPMYCEKIPKCPSFKDSMPSSPPGSKVIFCDQPDCDIAPAVRVVEGAPKLDTAEQMTQQNQKFDDEKLRFDLIPPEILTAIAEVLSFGAKKYGPNNWQQLDNFNSRFTAALMRHLNAWRSGETNDPESGKSHLCHMACNIAFLIWKESQSNVDKEILSPCIGGPSIKCTICQNTNCPYCKKQV